LKKDNEKADLAKKEFVISEHFELLFNNTFPKKSRVQQLFSSLNTANLTQPKSVASEDETRQGLMRRRSL